MFRVAVITASDKGYSGEREDISGRILCDMLLESDYNVVYSIILPDDYEKLSAELLRLCDDNIADLILTTGGTGFSPRDCTPEATLNIAERLAPGIAEAMRAHSLKLTNRAMLSRGVAVLRKKTLIINLPGSPKAARENLECILPALSHGLAILTEKTSECAQS